METPSSSPSPAFQNPNIPSIRPANSAAFKRENRRKHKEKKRQQKLQLLLEDWSPLAALPPPIAPPASVADWPLDPFSDLNPEPAAWNLNPRLPLQAHPQPPPSPEALAQENAVRLCREFFAAECGSDEEDWAVEDQDFGKSCDFFKGLFDKEAEMRDFYRRDRGKGEFCCIVCGGIGEKMGKKFVGSIAVAQHANFISKTRGVMAHRAYGRVVCELLGLEIDGFKGVDLDDSGSETEFQDEEVLKGAVAVDDAGEDGVKGGVEMNVDVV